LPLVVQEEQAALEGLEEEAALTESVLLVSLEAVAVVAAASTLARLVVRAILK